MLARLIALCGLLLFSAGLSAENAPSLDRFGARDFPGVAHAVTENGETVLIEVSGVRELGKEGPILPDTPFLVGSISKSFTALSIMQLVEAGEIELDAPVSRYLPEFEGTAAGSIPVHRLLNHTSGFTTAQGNTTQTDFDEDGEALARRVEALVGVEPGNPTGSTHQYSNANYQLLGRIIEVVSEQTYADYVEENILAPAGMRDSFVHPAARSGELAQGHRPWFGGFHALSKNMTGAGSAPQGGIAASARDMARYMALMMNQKDDILSAQGKARMMRSDDPVAPEYGYGWNIDAGTGRVWHGGSNAGYDAIVAMLPEKRRGSAVLMNAGSGLAFGRTGELRLGLTSEALGLEAPEAADATPFVIIFIALCVLPILFLFGIYRAWKRRHEPRRKSRWRTIHFWLSILLALLLAWGFVFGIPASFGADIAATILFVPDFGWLSVATAVTAVLWALTTIGLRFALTPARDQPSPART
ncbi:serine hydrolase domain-containing protein [Qipengyuania sphaerica]|uniref:serine hydrolase domain-containing protein n=1 Tax=Qipengyuania sphaerica TaxID=2867243 RepID=UPI001C88C5C3|nr:serine hydrolase domain-containing protein [Qipengyuania sphaerica]MBX7540235.1 beta-lactamase family protein [Qipengyuania sphaerica]